MPGSPTQSLALASSLCWRRIRCGGSRPPMTGQNPTAAASEGSGYGSQGRPAPSVVRGPVHRVSCRKNQNIHFAENHLYHHLALDLEAVFCSFSQLSAATRRECNAVFQKTDKFFLGRSGSPWPITVCDFVAIVCPARIQRQGGQARRAGAHAAGFCGVFKRFPDCRCFGVDRTGAQRLQYFRRKRL